MPWRRELVCGVAGLGYVPLAALEGADVLAAPKLGDDAPTVRGYLDAHADAMALTASAGLLSLVAYAVFAVTLFRLVRPAGRGFRPLWPTVWLLGALAGAGLAAVGQVSAFILLVRRDDLDDGDVTGLWDLSIDARTGAGIAAAVALLAIGTATRQGAVIPRALARIAAGLGASLLIASIVAVADHGESSRLFVLGVFGMAAVWVFVVATWLTLGSGGSSDHTDRPWGMLLRQVVCLVLVLAAGVTGIALLVLPGATAQLFSWGLAPRPLASFVGGCYVASAIVFAGGVTAPAGRVRGVMVGALIFATSTVAVTLNHTEVFDFDRLQAVAWIVLFPVFAAAVAVVLLAEPNRSVVDPDHRLGTAPKAAAAVLAVALAAGAVALWIDPVAVDHVLPFALSPMGGRFLGCWLALLAVMAASVGASPSVPHARLPAIALLSFPASALIALVRVPTDLTGGWHTGTYVAAIAVVAAVGAWLTAATAIRRSA